MARPLTQRVIRKRLLHVWGQMKRRCYDPKEKSFERYGVRGITICVEWRTSFTSFYHWALKNRYAPGLTLERKNNSGKYTPRNCKWATIGEQCRNRRSNVWITAFGKTQCAKDWADDPRCVVTMGGLLKRIHMGVPAQDAITFQKVKGGSIAGRSRVTISLLEFIKKSHTPLQTRRTKTKRPAK